MAQTQYHSSCGRAHFSLSLFALPLERQWLGGYAVYLVLLVYALFGLVLATRLPRHAMDTLK